jgi:hypothetical protein
MVRNPRDVEKEIKKQADALRKELDKLSVPQRNDITTRLDRLGDLYVEYMEAAGCTAMMGKPQWPPGP